MTVAACGGDDPKPGSGLPQGSEEVKLDPAEFTTDIDNPYWPMKPGSRWVYRETDSEGTVQRVEVTVTDRTKRIANGVEARVVHDEVTEKGEPVEITDDWYAQDSKGNVWYSARTRPSMRTASRRRRRARSRRAATAPRPGS